MIQTAAGTAAGGRRPEGGGPLNPSGHALSRRRSAARAEARAQAAADRPPPPAPRALIKPLLPRTGAPRAPPSHAIVSSAVGPEYYVSILSFVDKTQLEPGCSVLLHNKVTGRDGGRGCGRGFDSVQLRGSRGGRGRGGLMPRRRAPPRRAPARTGPPVRRGSYPPSTFQPGQTRSNR